jgi:hypothetical protein
MKLPKGKPTLDHLNDYASLFSFIGNGLDSARNIQGLSKGDKEELWDMVLTCARCSAVLDRIEMLNR